MRFFGLICAVAVWMRAALIELEPPIGGSKRPQMRRARLKWPTLARSGAPTTEELAARNSPHRPGSSSRIAVAQTMVVSGMVAEWPCPIIVKGGK